MGELPHLNCSTCRTYSDARSPPDAMDCQMEIARKITESH